MDNQSPCTDDSVRDLQNAASDLAELSLRMQRPASLEEYLEFRAEAGRIVSLFEEANNLIGRELGLGSARERILEYLLLHEGEVVEKEALAGVAGIAAFARRIRELRAEGWGISSMENSPELRPGQYVLKERRISGRRLKSPRP